MYYIGLYAQMTWPTVLGAFFCLAIVSSQIIFLASPRDYIWLVEMDHWQIKRKFDKVGTNDGQYNWDVTTCTDTTLLYPSGWFQHHVLEFFHK